MRRACSIRRTDTALPRGIVCDVCAWYLRWFVVDGVQYRLVSCIFRAARGRPSGYLNGVSRVTECVASSRRVARGDPGSRALSARVASRRTGASLFLPSGPRGGGASPVPSARERSPVASSPGESRPSGPRSSRYEYYNIISLSTLSSRHARRVTRRHGRVSAHRSRQWWCRCLRRCVRLRSQYDRRKVPVRSHANFFVDIRVTFATSVPRLGCHHKFRCRANRHALFINPALISFMKRAGARQTVASPALCSWGKAARAFR